MASRKVVADRKKKALEILQFVVADPIAKLICLLLAGLLWMYVSGQAQSQYEFLNVPVSFTEVQPGLVVTDDSQKTVSIRVTGPASSLGGVTYEDFKVVASLKTSLREGEKWVVLSRDNVIPPRGDIAIERIEPGSLRIFLERLSQKTIHLTSESVKLSGEAPAGFEVMTEITPETVTVYGAKSLLQRINSLSTEKVNISGQERTFIAPPVKVLKEYNSIQRIEPTEVEVKVIITEKFVERVIENIRVELQTPINGREVQIKPEVVSIKIRGPENSLKQLDVTQLKVFVDLPKDKPFHLSVPRIDRAYLNERIEVVSYDPALIRVSVPGQ